MQSSMINEHYNHFSKLNQNKEVQDIMNEAFHVGVHLELKETQSSIKELLSETTAIAQLPCEVNKMVNEKIP